MDEKGDCLFFLAIKVPQDWSAQNKCAAYGRRKDEKEKHADRDERRRLDIAEDVLAIEEHGTDKNHVQYGQ